MSSASEGDFGHRIFMLQKKQAVKGSTFAQYKLGTFYEFGISVKPDSNEAKIWYEKAAEKNNKPAANRLTYLEIKKLGYNKSKHLAWVNKIINETQQSNVHSMIILGQLYHRGLAVNQDLEKAIKLLRKASSRGHTEVDNEIAEINKILQKDNPSPEPAITAEAIVEDVQEPVIEQPKKETVKAKPPKPEAALKKQKKKKKAKKTNKKSEEERRRRYEKAMRKQYREELILQSQQEWSEDEEEEEESEEQEEAAN